MKNLISTLLFVTTVCILSGCNKTQHNNSMSSNSLAGITYEDVEVKFYAIDADDAGNCEGWFIQPQNLEFDFVIQVNSGLSDSIKHLESLDKTSFKMDIKFTGVNYYCSKQWYKTKPTPTVMPHEIQFVNIENVTTAPGL